MNWHAEDLCEYLNGAFSAGRASRDAEAQPNFCKDGHEELHYAHPVEGPSSCPLCRPQAYARGLTINMARAYPAVAEWRPLADLDGLLSQIDNMAAGFIQQRDAAREQVQALRDALARTEMAAQLGGI